MFEPYRPVRSVGGRGTTRNCSDVNKRSVVVCSNHLEVFDQKAVQGQLKPVLISAKLDADGRKISVRSRRVHRAPVDLRI
jgi:hypothetical protein